MAIEKLTQRKVDRATEAGRFADGRGLYLQVTPAGNRSWILRYERDDHRPGRIGKRRERWMGLGPADDFDLKKARERASEARRLLKDGIDPLEARREARSRQYAEKVAAAAAEAGRKTFAQCAQLYFDRHSAGWKNKKHRAQFLATLNDYVFPTIGALPVADVNRDLVLACVQPIWTSRNATAVRVLRRIRWTLDFAKVNNWRDGENPAAWDGNLEHALPAPGEVATVKHHPALAFEKIHDFVAQLRQQPGIPAAALEFLILCASRSGEVTGARWDEIDFAKKRWVVPAARMKAKKNHNVPLSNRAIAILQALPRESDFVFPGSQAGKRLSHDALDKMLKRLRSDCVVHGFRSCFRDWAAEKTTFANHIVELALAHAIGNKVEAAYRRGDLLEQRAALMADWSRYIDTPPAGDAVVTPIRARR